MSVSHLRFILIFDLLNIFFTEVEADHTAHGNLTLIFLFSREVEDQDDLSSFDIRSMAAPAPCQ